MRLPTTWLLQLYRLAIGWSLYGAAVTGNAQSVLPQPEQLTDRQGLPQAFVPAIVQDHRGFIWMATRDGLARYDGQRFRVFQPRTDGQPGLSSAGLTMLQIDHRGWLWIHNELNGLDCFDPVRETFQNISRLPLYRRQVGRDTLSAFHYDRHNRLWIVLKQAGLLCFGSNYQQVRRFRHEPGHAASLASNTVATLAEDGAGQIWVATDRGLDRFDGRTGTFTHYTPRPGDPTALPGSGFRVMHRRSNGDLLLVSEQYLTVLNHRTGRFQSMPLPRPGVGGWQHQIGTDTQGNDYIDRNNQLFRLNSRTLQLELLARSMGDDWQGISLFVDRSDVLWVGTDVAGVRKFNLSAGRFISQPYQRHFHQDLLTDYLHVPAAQLPRFGAGSSSFNLRSAFDRQGGLWFTVGETPFYRLDLTSHRLKAVPFPIAFRTDNELNRPTLLAADPAGQVQALHEGRLYAYTAPAAPTGSGTWQQLPYSLRAVESPLLQMSIDQRSYWLITASKGLYRLDRQMGRLQNYAHQPTDTTSLSSNSLYCLFADPDDPNTLWIGTFGAGLCRFNKRTGHCQRISTRQGLPNNVVYAAIPDRSGHVWIATNRGLCRFNKHTGQTRTYTREDGLSADEFNRFHFLQLPGRGKASGRIILGGIEGTTAFYPDQLAEDTYQPPVEITGIHLNNRAVEPGPHSPIGEAPVEVVQALNLPYDQNFLTVDFAALEFNNPGRLRYRYRLDDVDRNWIETDRPQAIYTDLSPGTYTLTLNATNTSGRWSRHQRTLTVRIRSPWWATGWAWLAYALGLGGIGLGLVRAYWRQREARQLQTVAELKERFFANITHELRTPLTLMLGPAERIVAEADQPTIRQQGELIGRQGRQLLRLINQLLDVTKLESATWRVDETRGDLAAFVADQVQAFALEAEASGMALQLTSQAEPGDYWFDRDKLAAILTNLIGNALKFTERNGRVDVRLWTAAPPSSASTDEGTPLSTCIRVSDNGIGISPAQLPHLFDRFYQADAPSPRQQPGTGLGLAVVKELADLLGGTITVASAVGVGSTFTFTVPLRRVGHVPAAETAAPATRPEHHQPPLAANETRSHLSASVARPPADVPTTGEAPLVLVADDNPDLLAFMVDCLREPYRIIQATDGQVALELARRHLPDLVISDVMMPHTDGYELTHALKTDSLTSHIPVMLLTAKTALDSTLTGLDAGADDYVTKPFHVRELQLRVRNLLETRRRLRERLRATWEQPDLAPPTDEPLLTALYAVLDTHLDDSSFGVEELTQKLGLSRMTLHRKLKAITDLTASELIRHYRLKRATQLLRAGRSVSETAYTVGFESPSYFTRRFREQYGQTPTDWLASNAPARHT